ncbi:MAG: MFS transporter [Gammaproteobacteria bacterium]|nr:MFS transporter [Gammaproteobacteria bacterium]
MRRTLLSLAALFLAMGTTMAGFGHIGTFLSLRMGVEGFAEWTIGPVMSGYYVGLVIGATLCQRIVQRVGHIRAFSVFAASNCAAVLFMPLWSEPVVWLLLRVVMGVSAMGMMMIVESWLNERAPAEIRGRVFSFYMVVSFLGLGSGQYLLNIAPIEAANHFLVMGILFTLCVLPVALTSAVLPQPVGNISINWSRIWKTAPFGLAGALVAGSLNGAFYSMAPLYVKGLGADVSQIANFMAISLLGGLVLQLPVGLVSDRFDRRTVLATLALLLSLSSLGMLFIPAGQFWLLYLAIGAFGGLLFTLYPVAVAHTHDHFDSNQVVVLSAALIISYGLGAVIGPLLVSLLNMVIGAQALFTTIAVTCLLFGTTIYLRRGFETVDIEDQEPFVPVASSTPVINTLDPRADEDQVTEMEDEYPE